MLLVVVPDADNFGFFGFVFSSEVAFKCLPRLELGSNHFLPKAGESCSLCSWWYKITLPEVIQELNFVNAQISNGTKNIYGGLDISSMYRIARSRCSSCVVFQ